MLRLGFIGAGAIGSLFGGYLANLKEMNIDVVLFCSQDHALAIKNHGLKIKTEGRVIIIKNLKVFTRTMEDNVDDDFDFLFLTTKTYDTRSAINQYKEIIENSKYFIILQNGIGNEDMIHPLVPKQKIFRLVTSHGAILNHPGQVTHTGKGFSFIGIPYLNYIAKEPNLFRNVQNSLAVLNELLNVSGLNSQVEIDISIKVWEKAIVNIGINAIGALTRLNNGNIIEIEGLRELMERAVVEAVEVGNNMNIPLSRDECIQLLYSVAKNTYHNKNSMLQDIIKGKKTEIDNLNGAIVDLANKLKIKVEVNEILTKLIKGLENSL